MGSPINTGSHPKALWPGVANWFGFKYNEYIKEYEKLFDVMKSSRAYEEDVESHNFGLMSVQEDGGPLEYEGQAQGYTARYIHAKYSKGVIVTEDEIDDNLYAELAKSRAEGLAYSKRQTLEFVAALVYNRAHTAGYTGGDGSILCTTTHAGLAGTWSNTLSTGASLSEDSIEDVCTLIGQTEDSQGNPFALRPRSLIVPVALQFEAHRVVKSALQNDTANNAVNAIKEMGMFPEGIMVSHYLSDNNAFFVRTDCPHGMKMFMRKDVPLVRDNDFGTGNALMKSSVRFSVGWTNPRGLFSNNGGPS